jgi:D-alanyl-D-alanine-carboxypeptidase/D-alanyl-D-alanine-endopeptidase
MIEQRVGHVLKRSAARHAGLVVGVRAGSDVGLWSRGELPDGSHSVFEIGSISKTFTAMLLAGMARDGLVALDDPLATHLPVAPPVKGREITLEDLATHHSGLPRLPAGLLVAAMTSERRDPYARYDDATLRATIRETKPKRAPGERFVYSNYGYGLLGYALARRAGTTYAELLQQRLTGPLGLADTGLDKGPLTQGHGLLGRDAHAWDLAELAGAGGIRSTASDLLTYLALHAPGATGPLAEAAADTRVRHRALGKIGIGLAWLLLPAGAGPPWSKIHVETIMHEGGTGGFRTFAAVAPSTGTAVVVLGSSARSVTRLGADLVQALTAA